MADLSGAAPEDDAVARHAARSLVQRLRDPITGPVHAVEAAGVIEALLRERGALRQRVSQAERAMQTTIEDCKRQGVSFGRLMANYAAGMFERERDAARAEVERLREALSGLEAACEARASATPSVAYDVMAAHGMEPALLALDCARRIARAALAGEGKSGE